MKILKKIAPKLLAVIVALCSLMMAHGVVLAATFTQTQVQNATVYFEDASAKTLSVVIGGTSYQFTTSSSDPIGSSDLVTYVPKNPSLFCVPAVNSAGAKPLPGSSYLGVIINSSTPLSGGFNSDGQGDPAQSPNSNLYAGTTPQNCVRSVPKNNNIVLKPGAASSAMFTDKTIGNIKGSNFAFSDGANISFTFNSQTISLYDKQPEDNNRNFTPKNSNDQALFCTSISGITFNNADQSKDRLPVKFQIAYIDNSKGGQCEKKTLNLNVPNPDAIATKVLQWDNTDITSMTGSLTLSQQASSKTIYLKDVNDVCGGGWAVKLDSAGANSGTLYQVAGGSGAASIGLPNCKIASQRDVLVGGTQGTSAIGATDNGDSSSKCVASSSTGLEWLLCPITTSLSAAVDKFNGLIESQLNFDVNDNLSNTSPAHTAWAVLKDLASVILVILMLVMVFSQAIGGTIFEAYTVRKMLPRLVIAVVTMQVSWDLCKLLVSYANDAGQGIAWLLTSPFGGTGNVDLNSILHRLDPGTWAAVSTAIIPVVLISGVVIAFVALPGVFVMAFSLFIGVFAALMVLLFRNVLIEALIIFAPLAFLAWTVKGTETYWKLWKDNFTKLLLMFPLIMSVIYVGRIFAWIVAGAGHPGFIDYLTILVAYFGPYFIIFRSYKWGGSLMSAAGSGIAGARKGITNANSGWLKTMGERAQGNLADRYKVRTSTEREIQDRINKRKAQGKRTDRLDELLKNTQQRPFSGKRRFGLLPVPNAEWMKNYALRVGAGTPLPTERQKVETLAKAGNYKKDLVEKKGALIHTDFVEELSRNGGNVGKAKEFIRNRYGLDNYERDASGKIITDANGDPKVKDKYTDRAFNNWMIDTQSWMELGDADWRMGAIKGKIDKAQFMPGGRYASMNRAIAGGRSAAVVDRVATMLSDKEHIIGYETDPTLSTDDILLKGKKPKLDIAKTTGFMGMMNADPQRYRAVSEKFPLFQPFNQELGGGPKSVDYLPAIVDSAGAVLATGGSKATADSTINVDSYLNHASNPSHDPAIARELAEIERENLGTLHADDARYAKWLTNMEHTTDIGTVRAEHYNMMNDISKELAKRGLKMKSSATLEGMLQEMATSSSMEGRSIVQRLMGGEKSARAAINDMYGKGYLEALLNVDIKSPTIQASAAGKRMAVLPGERALHDETQVRSFIQQLLNNMEWDPSKKGANPLAIELIQTLGEVEGYAQAAHGANRDDYMSLFNRLYSSVEKSEAGTEAVNQLVDRIIKYRMWRAGRAYNEAMSQGKPATEAAIIAEKAMEVVYGPVNYAGVRAGGEIDRLEALKRALPPDDPTVLYVHEPPPQNPLFKP